MNSTLQNHARSELKAGMAQLPESSQMLFKRMYSHKNLELDIDTIIDTMPEEKLDWAMQQVERSLEKAAQKETLG